MNLRPPAEHEKRLARGTLLEGARDQEQEAGEEDHGGLVELEHDWSRLGTEHSLGADEEGIRAEEEAADDGVDEGLPAVLGRHSRGLWGGGLKSALVLSFPASGS